MPSTYTLNNGIELIGTGEQSGTWGDTTNTNLELLDAALDGQVTITATSAGTSGSPNDLPISDGSASDGRNRMVIITSATDLGADVYYQLTPNDAEKIIYVRNDLNAQDLILFQGTYSASNDYVVPNGKTAVIFFDGAGTGAVAANVFNNAHFDALNVVGGGAFGGAVTVTTGDSGATAASNADDLVVEASGDGGISILNPASNTGTLFFGDQSAGNMGQIKYSHTDDAMSIVTAQNTAIVIDSSRQVLIGSLGSSVTVNNDEAGLQLTNSGTLSHISQARFRANSSSPIHYFSKSRSVTVGTYGTIVQDDDAAGQIIWTADDGVDSNSQVAAISANVDGTPGANDMPGRLVFSTTADGASSVTERMRIDSAGNVGIGSSPETTTSTYKALELGYSTSILARTAANQSYFGNNTYHSSDWKYKTTDPAALYQQIDGQHVFFNAASGTADTTISFSEAMRIDSSRRVLIGNNTYVAGVAGNGTDLNPSLNLYKVTSSSTEQGFISSTLFASSGGARRPFQMFQRSRSSSAGSYSVVSDDDSLGTIVFNGDDGDSFIEAATIETAVDGTPGNNDMPGRIAFHTTSDGASAATERMRITSAGDIGIGTLSPTNSTNYVTVDIRDTDGGQIILGRSTSTDTFIYSGSSGTTIGSGTSQYLRFLTNSTGANNEAMRIDSVQRVSLGGGDVRKNYFGSLSSYYLTLGLEYTGGGNASEVGRFWGHTYNSGGDNRGGMLLLGKSRGTTRLSNTVLTSADTIYRIGFLASDGTYMYESAEIAAEADGGMGSADVPGRLIFKTTSDGAASPSERMRIDRDGHVGLNSIDPRSYYAQELVINTSDEGGITLVGGTGAENYIMWADGTTGLDQYRGYIGYDHSGNHLRFGANGTENMRLLSNGSALIGSTTTDGFDGTVGLKIESAGPSLLLTRTGARHWLQYVASDQSFRLYDSTDNIERFIMTNVGDFGINTVSPSGVLDASDNAGSLGSTKDITAQFIRNDGTYGPRLQIRHSTTGSDIHHTYSSSASNLTFSIGNTEVARFLSGGGLTFNGDTAAANALDDYEEGSFTVYWSNSSASTNINAGTFYYTKIGRQVTVSGYTSTSNSVAGLSGQVFLRGLPYAMASGSNYQGVSPVLFRKKAPPNSSGNYGLVGYMRNNTSAIEFWWSGRDNYEYNFMSYSQWYSNTSNNDFYITLTYFAA